MRKVLFYTIPYFLLSLLFLSCASYRQNIMFKVENETSAQHILEAEKNYRIQKDDYLSLEVFTNEGERVIDPDYKLMEGAPVQNQAARSTLNYLVNHEGNVKFPMVGVLHLEGLTLREAEDKVQQEYAKYYHKPFVVIQYQNKRVIVLGAPGGQVIPLTNENMTLVEVLALAKGLSNDAKAYNIRVMREDKLYVADLSTFEGYKKNNMVMEPGDVIYVEPIRKPFAEGVRDYGPAITILTSITTLLVVIIGL